MKPMRFVLSYVFFVTLLSACSSTNTPPVTVPETPAPEAPTPETPAITSLGVVSLEVFDLGVLASGTFVKTQAQLDITAGNPYTPLLDQCTVIGEGTQPPSLPGETPPDAEPLGAGDKVMINNGGAAYIELTKDTSTDLSNYTGSTETALPGTPLTLEIPGEAFPAFSDVPLELIPAFDLTAPTNTSAITPTTVFRWEGSSDNGVISLQMTRAQPNISVECFAKDDGEFSFSDATKAELEAAGFRRGTLNPPVRLAARYEVRDDAALLVITKQREPR
jgi:hypothetical protein